MKIAVIGYSGCGKSTLTEYIGKKRQLPILFLDKIHWLPGWKERPAEEERKIVSDFLDQHDSWVIDGNYSKICWDRRMKDADRIVFLAFGRGTCLLRALKRYVTWRGKTRKSMTKGCPEKIDIEFVKWILWDGRVRRRRRIFETVKRKYPDKMVCIKCQRQMKQFLIKD